MKILIHAVPQRMWYVVNFLIPMLQKQGAESIEVWNDTQKNGNLRSCMASFADRQGHGGTWHIQDDVLPCRDFVQRCAEYESDGVVYGFACDQFNDSPDHTGRVYAPDIWHSFQCIRIPDDYARECAAWFYGSEWLKSAMPELPILNAAGKGDDTFFREFLQTRHGTERFTNAKPNLVEHVDWLLGGSTLSQWRGSLARAMYWDDQELLEELKQEIKRFQSA